MPLLAHLRELRTRLFRASLGVLAGTLLAIVFYDPLFDLVIEPFDTIRAEYARDGSLVQLNFGGVADPFSYPLKICLMAGLLASSPVWLYQLWAFVTPGLHRHERRWAIGFVFASVPLFLGGAVLAYFFLPKGFDLLVGFNPAPEKVANLIGFDKYLSFVIRMMLVFSISFVAPVFLVALNLVGIVHARQLVRAWRPVILGSFVFAAVATPSGDPFTMTALAAPLLVLYFAAAGVCALNDRRKRRSGIDGLDYAAIGDDEASPLDLESAPVEKRAPAAKKVVKDEPRGDSGGYGDDWT
jgi:sec-independent protein translocase protein TatC